ncbi:hypothetical protein ACVMHZ_009751 [Bradyrhizobium liaoningense]
MADAPDFNAIASDILATAALLHRFDPLALMPEEINPATQAKALATVARFASEVDWQDPKNPRRRLTLWRLNPTARRSQLARLCAEGKLQEAVKKSDPPRDDVFARYLQAALVGKLKPDSVSEADFDTAAVAADFAAEALGKDSLANAAREAATSLRTMLSQQADRRRSGAILPGKLVGRAIEQEILDSFVKTGIVPASDRLPEATNPQIQVRPYLLTGTPGAGKSALVSDIVRRLRGYPIDEPSVDWSAGLSDPIGTLVDAATAAKAATVAVVSAAAGLFQTKGPPANQPVVLLDFDRPGIALGREFEWTADTTRQLGYARPALAAKLSDMRARVRQDQAKLDPSGKSTTWTFTATSDVKTGLASELGSAGLAGGILVVVLDTFEEVVVRSPVSDGEMIPASLLGRVLMWADSLATLRSGNVPTFSAVHVIASGREKPDLDSTHLGAWFVAHRVIGDLDMESAVTFLHKRDRFRRFNAKLARAAVEKLGGHPLTLILLEAYSRHLPLKEIIKTVNDGNIGRIFGSENAIKTLYSRFLQRLHHDLELNDGVTPAMVQAVAHPGLMLREITPDILREVICPACGLGAISPDTAKALFERLRSQIWLVENIEGKTTIRHRRDIRRLMLPMMTGDPDGTPSSPELWDKMMAVHRNAATWYDRTSATDSDAQLEALYHRAFLSDGSFQKSIAALAEGEASELLRRVAESAGADVSVMPVANRAMLRFFSAGAGRMTAGEIKALPSELAKRAEIELLELNRGTVSRMPDTLSTTDRAAAGSVEPDVGALATEASIAAAPQSRRDATPAEDVTGTADPFQLFRMINDRELNARIGFAMTSGDFAVAANTGWRAIAELSAFPDLSERLRYADDPTTHWFWQAAIASLALPHNESPAREMLERLLQRFADSVNHRAEPDAAGLMFAAATTIAIGDRPSAAVAAATSKLAHIVQRMRGATTNCDLRLLAIHGLWLREPWFSSEMGVQVRLGRIQLFSEELLRTNPILIPGLQTISNFVSNAKEEKVSSREVDAFVATDEYILISGYIFRPNLPAGRLLTGVTPELYDSAVRALIDSDNLSYGSVDGAISDIMARAPFWPHDLVPDGISSRDKDLRAGFLARVVVHADRCGLLVPLFERTKSRNASIHLHQLAQLLARYENVRNLAYTASPLA